MPYGLILQYALKYLPHIIVITAVIGGYLFWHHHVYEKGYNDAVEIYEARDIENAREAQALLDQRMEENAIILEEQKSRYIGAIETYAKHIKDINASATAYANQRLYVRTKPTNTCSNAMSSSTGNTGRTNSGSGGIYQAELAEEVTQAIHDNAREVALGAASCQKLLDLVR